MGSASLPPRGNTPSGSVDPSSPLCPLSSPCGSPSRNTMSAAHPSSTASASKYIAFKHICDIASSIMHIENCVLALYLNISIIHLPFDVLTLCTLNICKPHIEKKMSGPINITSKKYLTLNKLYNHLITSVPSLCLFFEW